MKVPARRMAWPLAALMLISPVVHADDLADLKAEVASLKADYAQRIAALQSRIDQLEQAQAAAAAAPPPPPAATAQMSSPAGDMRAFNPAISVILAGTYADLSQDPSTYRIAGFMPSGGEVGPGEGGFNLGESELTFMSNVDPYFAAQLTTSIDNQGGVNVEEAFFRTAALPAGFTMKGGRFLSGIGYLNEVHAHAWDFVDAPLVYQAMFGGQLAQDGVQLKWIAPTDLFMEFGAEAGNGGAFPGTQRIRSGVNSVALFAHVGGDVGYSLGWRAGVSWLGTDARDRTFDDLDAAGDPVTNAFTGRSRTWVADATLKWSALGDPLSRGLKLQGEYMHRTESGSLAFDTTGVDLNGGYRSSQSGWYLQGVYRFLPRWRAGLRYDRLDSGSPRIGLVQAGLLGAGDFPSLLSATPHRVSAMLDFSTSEFSRLRAEYSWDDARDAAQDRQLLIQYIFAIGAHGAHKF